MRSFIFWAAIILCFSLYSCESNQTRVAEGAGLGGLVGATAGGVIGHQSGHGAEGALIGAAAGAAGGGIIGSQVQKKKSQPSGPRSGPATVGGPRISMVEVVELTKQGVSSDEIIARIKSTESSYSLTPDDIAYLKREGVSQRVIEVMQGY